MAKGKKTGGRQKGAPNRFSRSLKDKILMALEMAGDENYLFKQATDNPSAFMTLIGKTLPLTLEGDKENPLAFTIVTGVPRDTNN